MYYLWMDKSSIHQLGIFQRSSPHRIGLILEAEIERRQLRRRNRISQPALLFSSLLAEVRGTLFQWAVVNTATGSSPQEVTINSCSEFAELEAASRVSVPVSREA